MNEPKTLRSTGAIVLSLTFALAAAWSCVAVSAVHAQEEEDNSGPLEPQTREHTSYLSVMGETLRLPSRECGQIVQNALRENRALAVDDDECREVMMEALEIQRTAPPLPPSGPAVQGRHRGGVRYVDPESAKRDAEAQPPPSVAAPNPDANPPFAEKSPN
jgi:hypothetical protein